MNRSFAKTALIVLFAVNPCSTKPMAGEARTADHHRRYPSKGTIEICGSISLSGSFYDDSYRLIFDFAPGISYFFADDFDIGFEPNVRSVLNHAKSHESKLHHSIAPHFSVGYVLRINDRLFLDTSPGIGFNYNDRDDRWSIRYYTLTNSLKYNLGNVLIMLNIHYDYIDYVLEHYGRDYSQIRLGIGYALYF